MTILLMVQYSRIPMKASSGGNSSKMIETSTLAKALLQGGIVCQFFMAQ
jgi:hypothetical protein